MDFGALEEDVEAVSAGYADRNGIERSNEWLVLKLNEEVGELTQPFLSRSGQARDKGLGAEELEQAFRAEVADVFAQVLLIVHRFGIDLPKDVDAKSLMWKPSS